MDRADRIVVRSSLLALCALVVILCHQPAHAGVVMVGKVPVITGNTSQAADPAERRVSGACFWQVPGQLNWVNVHAMLDMRVTCTGSTNDSCTTILGFGYRQEVRIGLKSGQDITSHTNAVLKRITECKEGN